MFQVCEPTNPPVPKYRSCSTQHEQFKINSHQSPKEGESLWIIESIFRGVLQSGGVQLQRRNPTKASSQLHQEGCIDVFNLTVFSLMLFKLPSDDISFEFLNLRVVDSLPSISSFLLGLVLQLNMDCISISSEPGTPPHLILNNRRPSFSLPLVVLLGGSANRRRRFKWQSQTTICKR
jgi:hypothetical protein